MSESSQFFEKSTPSGAYTVIVKTRGDFYDGQLLVMPPIIPNERFLETITADDKVAIGGVLVGKEATLMSYISDDQSEQPDYRENIEEVVESLLEDLEKVSGPEEFKNTF